MKCFSLKCVCMKNEYDTHIIPLLRRMSNLEELTLDVLNHNRATFIDGTHINNKILVHMPRLDKFTFCISAQIKLHKLVHYLSKDDIQRTFTNIEYKQVDCILGYYLATAMCHVFSVPCVFKTIEYIGKTFPQIVVRHVTSLSVHDIVPFQHEYFIRIARSFPMLRNLCVINFQSQSLVSDRVNSNDSIIEYPYLSSLGLYTCHIDYVEQFLNNTKTYLPRLTELTADYEQLTIVTENFTRNITRLNCAKIKELFLERPLVHSKDFYVYFPLL